MTLTELVISQFSDVFRIGLMVALCFMTLRLREQSGFMTPLVAGILFFAVLLPTTQPKEGAGAITQMLTGVFVNAVIVAIVLGLYAAYLRFRR